MRSNWTSASFWLVAVAAAAVLPSSGTVSGSGSSTSTYFWSEWISCSLRSSGAIVSSAISRRATTGFLSRSRSIVSCEPAEISRARWLASRTSSKRLSTLSMQSSTVTRAMGGSFARWRWRKAVVYTKEGAGTTLGLRLVDESRAIRERRQRRGRLRGRAIGPQGRRAGESHLIGDDRHEGGGLPEVAAAADREGLGRRVDRSRELRRAIAIQRIAGALVRLRVLDDQHAGIGAVGRRAEIDRPAVDRETGLPAGQVEGHAGARDLRMARDRQRPVLDDVKP